MHDTLRPKARVPLTFQDGPDMFHVATTPNLNPNHKVGYTKTDKTTGEQTFTQVSNVSLGHTHDEELYKVRTKPHLYEDWHVQMVEDQREAYLSTLPEHALDWDCHHCKRAVVTLDLSTDPRCPNCGWR